MQPDTIYHNILLRIPLNIVWRLVGLNRQLNKLLSSELLWRRRSEKEFPLLHSRITSYRLYYLIRSECIRNNLYSNNRLIVKNTDNLWLYHSMYLYLNSEGLYLNKILIVPKVAKVVGLYDERNRDNYLITKQDGEQLLMELEDRHDPILGRTSFDPRLIDVVTMRISNKGLKWLLYDTGELLYLCQDKLVVHERDVIQILPVDSVSLLVLYKEGHMKMISVWVHDHPVFQDSLVAGNNYIRLMSTNKTFYATKATGESDRILLPGEDDKLPVSRKCKSPLPIHKILTDDAGQQVIVMIDGSGYVVMNKHPLLNLSEHQEINVHGLSFYTQTPSLGSVIVAVSLKNT